MGGAKKKIKKIIPKEIAPATPFIASALLGPAFAGSNFLTSKIGSEAIRNAVAKGIIAAGTSKAQGGKTKDALRSAALAAAPDVISGGLGEYAKTGQAAKLKYGDPGFFKQATQQAAAKASGALKPTTFMGQAKIVGAQSAIEGAQQLKELQEQQLRDYEAKLREQGITNAADRRKSIYGYFVNAGYEPTYVNTILDKYGYAKGGRVEKASLEDFGKKYEQLLKERKKAKDGGRIGYSRGGRAMLLASLVKDGIPYEKAVQLVDEEVPEEFDLSGLQAGIGGLETAFGRPFFDQAKPVPMLKFANGGMPAMQMRKTIAELIQTGVIDEEDVEQAIAEIRNRAMMSMRAPGMQEGGLAATDEADVYMTDEGRSGVIYKDNKGNVISKEEFFEGTDERQDKAMGGIMKAAGKQLMKRIVRPVKRKIGQMTDDVEIDVNFDADMYDDGTSYGITEINILPKTKKGKEALDQAVEEGSAELSSDGSYFIKEPEEVSGLLYEKGIKVSGVNKPTYSGKKFETFAEGAKYGDDGYNIPDYEIEMFEDLATRKGRADGGIMNVSDLNNDRFLEQRAEQYMEEGLSPEDAMDKALDDLKNNKFPALKDGGMLNLRKGGMPAEMDMRGGGFIPIGKKERADDVPARLSKNEFVMTADAVRAAGNGSINKGAKRMYDLMNKLEAKK